MIDGRLVAMCEQERYDLQKHTRTFPTEAINDCLKLGGVQLSDVDEIAFPDDVIFSIRERYLKPALEDDFRIGFMINDIEKLREKYNIESVIRERTGFQGPIRFYRHHLCHLASAYYPSGFDEAILMSHDGLGEIESSMYGIGRGGAIEVIHDRSRYPHSLGLLYAAVTFFLGWRINYDEGITMGLAPYGDSSAPIPGDGRTYYDVLSEILQPGERPFDYSIDQSWMAYYRQRNVWVSDKFLSVFGPKRAWEDPLTDHHGHLAAALQDRLEDVVMQQLQYARDEYGISRLAIAGGVGLNCSLNGKIMTSGVFEEIFVQPASGDAGLPIGACALAHRNNDPTYVGNRNHDFYLGSRFDNGEIRTELERQECDYQEPEDLFALVAQRLADGKIVGWFQGRSECGPRALGNRSILCRPYPAGMKDYINARVKFREPFRPFAPAVLWEHARDWFQLDQETPHMLQAVQVVPDKRDRIPAVVHVDGSCRAQTVTPENNLRFRKVLEAFHALTDVPVLLNTSFNVKGQPIVNTPEQAIQCFRSTQIDCLAIGDLFVEKRD